MVLIGNSITSLQMIRWNGGVSESFSGCAKIRQTSGIEDERAAQEGVERHTSPISCIPVLENRSCAVLLFLGQFKMVSDKVNTAGFALSQLNLTVVECLN